MDDIINIAVTRKSRSINWWCQWNSKTSNKKKEGGLLPGMMAPMADSLIQPVASSLTNAITGKTVRRSGKEQEGGFLPLLALPLTMKVLRKEVTRTGKGYNNMDHMDQNV